MSKKDNLLKTNNKKCVGSIVRPLGLEPRPLTLKV